MPSKNSLYNVPYPVHCAGADMRVGESNLQGEYNSVVHFLDKFPGITVIAREMSTKSYPRI